VRRVADHEDVFRVEFGQAARAGAVERKGDQGVAIRRIISECPAAEVAPQIEVLEFDPRTRLEVPGQQPEEHVVSLDQDVEQIPNARHDRFYATARTQRLERLRPSGLFDLLAEVGDVTIPQSIEQAVIQRASGTGDDIGQDDPIGPAGNRNSLEGMRVADQLFAGAVHRPDPGAAGQHERPINIEQNQFSHGGDEAIYNRESGGSLTMKRWTVSIATFAVAFSGAIVFGQAAGTPAPQGGAGTAVRAQAAIKGEGISGKADFVERTMGTGKIVDITVTATGLKPGLHGVHLHAIGKCEPDFAAAGGHFDPGPAGNMDPDANHPFHLGDVPNLEVAANGSGTMKISTSRVTLSEGPLSLFDADGSAIIIHANPDQGTTGAPKSGVSGGPRAACGVISK
jgi:superoxide dismutase, Cu-Zn family